MWKDHESTAAKFLHPGDMEENTVNHLFLWDFDLALVKCEFALPIGVNRDLKQYNLVFRIICSDISETIKLYGRSLRNLFSRSDTGQIKEDMQYFNFTATALQMTGKSKVYNQGCFSVIVTSMNTNWQFTMGIPWGLYTLITRVIHI